MVTFIIKAKILESSLYKSNKINFFYHSNEDDEENPLSTEVEKIDMNTFMMDPTFEINKTYLEIGPGTFKQMLQDKDYFNLEKVFLTMKYGNNSPEELTQEKFRMKEDIITNVRPIYESKIFRFFGDKYKFMTFSGKQKFLQMREITEMVNPNRDPLEDS